MTSLWIFHFRESILIINMINNMMINNMYNNNSIDGMNNMGMNPIGINNQQNLMNGMMAMDTTAQNIKNIIQPYENKIKELEEIIRQKDFEIAVLKQKLIKNSNPMNMNNPMNMMNNNPMNMNNGVNMMNMMLPNFNQIISDRGKKINLTLKFENNELHIDCFQNDKSSILREKVNLDGIYDDFVCDFKWIDPYLTFKENGIRNNSTIEIKPLLALVFRYNSIISSSISIILSNDCPLSLAISYYLIKLNNPFFLEKMIKNRFSINFLYNASRLNILEQTPIDKIFNLNNSSIDVFEIR